MPVGRFDQRCFCSVLVLANSTLLFSVLVSAARNAFAAATMDGVACCPVAVEALLALALLAVALLAVALLAVALAADADAVTEEVAVLPPPPHPETASSSPAAAGAQPAR